MSLAGRASDMLTPPSPTLDWKLRGRHRGEISGRYAISCISSEYPNLDINILLVCIGVYRI